ncbi:3-deoxy-D-manno-octulosonic acid transferase [Gillisia sp. M10.2A]|uniref:3-deoxy-D-manno-octulosonic acid transferase n=1 Tax=Gillisia lutea TaxID=2909668 RepID=A0ABS9EGF3_9FLAO|nr:glycosyltransferase N-terminal domain-containing protein [Gillisia lutea]MCF4101942.1 3-deoxy-D-manno-octulosonic acid transferase [Gillisia lutea]
MKLFVDGRKNTFSILNSKIQQKDRVIWFHVASLGEFEQGLPIIEVVKNIYPQHKIVLSFFSPSGYEVKKNTPIADAVVYLPLDTRRNVRLFLELAHPEMSFFVKYDFWPNYLNELKKRNIPSFLISGGFSANQLFFKSYGKWMRKSLTSFQHFFVQNESSKVLLNSIGFQNVNVSGDTRFDRVSNQLKQDNKLDFIEDFKENKTCIVAGSTWPEDEAMLQEFINNSSPEVKFIIAPHNIKAEQIQKFKNSLNKRTVLYSEKQGKELSSYQVFIIDTIGLLSKIYSYGDIAFVGGATGTTGLHNILEPATFGIPIIIGSNYSKFPEAIELQKLAGLYSVKNTKEFQDILQKLLKDVDFRQKTGMIAGHFISSNTGATQVIKTYLNHKNVKLS